MAFYFTKHLLFEKKTSVPVSGLAKCIEVIIDWTKSMLWCHCEHAAAIDVRGLASDWLNLASLISKPVISAELVIAGMPS